MLLSCKFEQASLTDVARMAVGSKPISSKGNNQVLAWQLIPGTRKILILISRILDTFMNKNKTISSSWVTVAEKVVCPPKVSPSVFSFS